MNTIGIINDAIMVVYYGPVPVWEALIVRRDIENQMTSGSTVALVQKLQTKLYYFPSRSQGFKDQLLNTLVLLFKKQLHVETHNLSW